MRPIAAFALLLVLFAASPAPAVSQTPEEQVELGRVLERGRLLFEIDRAAWVTTDDLRRRVGDVARAGVSGWTVERAGNGYDVVYFGGEGDARSPSIAPG